MWTSNAYIKHIYVVLQTCNFRCFFLFSSLWSQVIIFFFLFFSIKFSSIFASLNCCVSSAAIAVAHTDAGVTAFLTNKNTANLNEKKKKTHIFCLILLFIFTYFHASWLISPFPRSHRQTRKRIEERNAFILQFK